MTHPKNPAAPFIHASAALELSVDDAQAAARERLLQVFHLLQMSAEIGRLEFSDNAVIAVALQASAPGASTGSVVCSMDDGAAFLADLGLVLGARPFDPKAILTKKGWTMDHIRIMQQGGILPMLLMGAVDDALDPEPDDAIDPEDL